VLGDDADLFRPETKQLGDAVLHPAGTMVRVEEGQAVPVQDAIVACGSIGFVVLTGSPVRLIDAHGRSCERPVEVAERTVGRIVRIDVVRRVKPGVVLLKVTPPSMMPSDCSLTSATTLPR
jgi:hypothetical protein